MGRDFSSASVETITTIKGIPYPEGVAFRQLIITGPPGSGKSSLVARLGGWPEEGYLDLTQKNWWRNQVLNFRPREVHLGFPFEGFKEGHAVFDEEWLQAPTPVNLERIVIPPPKRRVWNIDWHKKYVFDFQLLPPDRLYEIRKKRASRGSHPIDMALTPEGVHHQWSVFASTAKHLHRNGLTVFFRTEFEGHPRCFT